MIVYAIGSAGHRHVRGVGDNGGMNTAGCVPQVPQVPRIPRVLLASLAVFHLLSAVAGALGLTVGGGIGFDPAWLDGTPFTSYFWPGIILGVIVGGIQVPALVAQRRRLDVAWGMHAAAGLAMMIWIFVELVLIREWSVLQGIYFTTGCAQVVCAVLALGAWPRPFLRRTD